MEKLLTMRQKEGGMNKDFINGFQWEVKVYKKYSGKGFMRSEDMDKELEKMLCCTRHILGPYGRHTDIQTNRRHVSSSYPERRISIAHYFWLYYICTSIVLELIRHNIRSGLSSPIHHVMPHTCQDWFSYSTMIFQGLSMIRSMLAESAWYAVDGIQSTFFFFEDYSLKKMLVNVPCTLSKIHFQLSTGTYVYVGFGYVTLNQSTPVSVSDMSLWKK